MSVWNLPVTVEVAGRPFAIRSDYRAVLDALAALNDASLSTQEQCAACLGILFPAWPDLPDYDAAFRAAMQWINLGKPVPEKQSPPVRLMDWEKDASIIAPAVDKVLGYSCRQCEYLHWWEFVGAFYGIGDGLFAQVVRIRSKRAKGKSLDKAEQAFARENADLIALPQASLTSEEEEFFKRLGV